jgi:tetratricopeptide (TPR) repeat protein
MARRFGGNTILLAALAVALAALPVRALPRDADAWIRLETANFTLFSNAGEGSTRRVAVDLERLRAALAQLDPGLELSSPSPTFLFVFRDGRSFAPYRLIFEGKPVDIGGYFLARPEANYVAIDADPRGNARAIVYHEYLHYVLRNNYPGLPLWLHEGVAELYSTFSAAGGTARVGIPVEEHARWLRENPLIPLAELFAVDVRSRDYNEGARRGVFYAESWALAHYLLAGSEARREQAPRFFQALARGESATAAFRSAFGDEAALERELRTYVRTRAYRYLETPVGPETEVAVSVRPLPRPDLLASLGFLLAFLDPSQAPAAAEHFRAALAEKPDHGPALAGLGLIEELAGRPAAAGPFLEKAAAAAPDDFLVQYRYGMNRLDQGDPESVRRARDAFVRAVALRPAFGDAWARLAFAIGLAGPITPESLPAFETAHRLLPGRMDVAFNLMLAYARTGQRKKAEEVIDRVIAVHGEPAEAERARAAWTDEIYAEAERLVRQEKLEEAIPLLEEAAAKAPHPDKKQEIGESLAEVRHALAYNRFNERYDQAVALANERKSGEAIAILKELVANAPTPGQADMARRLLEQLRGKRGGVRVIYFNRLAAGEIWLLVLYTKSEAENIPAHVLRRIKEEIEHG